MYKSTDLIRTGGAYFFSRLGVSGAHKSRQRLRQVRLRTRPTRDNCWRQMRSEMVETIRPRLSKNGLEAPRYKAFKPGSYTTAHRSNNMLTTMYAFGPRCSVTLLCRLTTEILCHMQRRAKSHATIV